jgi:hypothetical protein
MKFVKPATKRHVERRDRLAQLDTLPLSKSFDGTQSFVTGRTRTFRDVGRKALQIEDQMHQSDLLVSLAIVIDILL